MRGIKLGKGREKFFVIIVYLRKLTKNALYENY